LKGITNHCNQYAWSINSKSRQRKGSVVDKALGQFNCHVIMLFPLEGHQLNATSMPTDQQQEQT
jgi:hypothetical protein